MCSYRLLVPLIVCGWALPSIAQQTLDWPVGEFQAYTLDSGSIPNPVDQTATVFQHQVQIGNAAWLRVFFGAGVSLEGSSFIRITSLLDNEVQELDAAALTMWSNSTAYFNGDAVLVELVAAPQTTNRLVIDQIATEIVFGFPRGSPGQCGICGTDDRMPSNQVWTARLLPAGCTATIINASSCMVSAGHCIGGSMVVQFNVPNSTAGCGIVNPPAADQFPVLVTDFVNGGVGNDWSVFTTGTNNIGETAFERYGVLRQISTTVASTGQTATLTGYGVDDTCTLSQTQQTANGPISSVQGSLYTFSIDLRGGNSGSSLQVGGLIVGIATHCPCPNIATRIDLATFVAAREALCPSPPINDDCANAIPINDGATLFSNIEAVTDGPADPLCIQGSDGGQTFHDMWFTYTAARSGTLRVSTCEQHGGSADFDTDIVVYTTADCGNLITLGCNDDDPANPCGNNPDFHSTVEVSVAQGNTYLIRVGGGNNGDQGSGMLNIESSSLSISLPSGPPITMTAGSPTSFDVQITSVLDSIVPGSETLNYRYDGGVFLTTPLTPLGGGLYTATLPPANCPDLPEYYITADGALSGPAIDPATAPTDVYTSIVITGSAIRFQDNFETDTGWTTEILGATDGFWERAVPINDPTWVWGPISDSDSSGNCYVTGNNPGNSDVDPVGGAVRLNSPVFDLSRAGALISYDYFLSLSNENLADVMSVEINNNGGVGPWMEIARHESNGGQTWRHQDITQTDLDAAGVTVSATMMLRFTVNDGSPSSIVEGGVDAMIITGDVCTQTTTCTSGDINDDTFVDGDDIQRFVDILANGGGTAVEVCAGDLEAVPDMAIDTDDVPNFVTCLLNAGCP